MIKRKTTKILLLTFIFVGVLFTNSYALATVPSEGLHYCNDEPQSFETEYDKRALCYTVKKGDTLWGIADYYLDNGLDWKYLEIVYSKKLKGEVMDFRKEAQSYFNNSNYNPNGPRSLQVGTEVAVPTYIMNPFPGYESVQGVPVLHPDTGEVITYSSREDQGVLTAGGEVYAGPYKSVWHIRASEDRNHIVYIADQTSKDDDNCKKSLRGQWQFFVDGEPNPHKSCGRDFKLLTFSPDSSEYAVRNNKGDGSDPEQFFVLSSIGNGPYYHYIDSLIWLDNETLVYRAQRNDNWSVVVNHQDYETYDYIENLQVKDGEVLFDARHKDGEWSEEKINIK
jgi:hypothetical protein